MKQMLRKLIMLAAMLCCLVAFGDTPGLTAQVGKYAYTFTLLDGLTAAITGCSPRPTGEFVMPAGLDLEVWKEGALITHVPVSSVEEGCFANCTGLTSVEFPNTSNFLHIRANAFNGCVGLTNVIMHSGLASVGEKAFGGCLNLENVVIPDSVEEMGASVLNGCSRLRRLTIPFVGHRRKPGYNEGYGDNKTGPYMENHFAWIFGNEPYEGGVEVPFSLYNSYGSTIGMRGILPATLKTVCITGSVIPRGFNNCSTLAEVIVSKNATDVGAEAFCYCDGLTNVVISGAVSNIWYSAFRECANLSDVLLGENVATICGGAFYRCEKLRDLQVPDSVTSIGYQAFAFCRGLTDITIGKGVTNVGEQAFIACDNLKNVYISDMATWCSIDFPIYFASKARSDANPLFNGCNLYLNGDLVTTLSVPNGVTKIGTSAFNGCQSIMAVRIPNSVTNIGPCAFSWCTNMESIVVGNGVKSIDGNAFYGCTMLKEVHITDIAAWCDITFGMGNVVESATVVGDVSPRRWGDYSPSNPLLYSRQLFLNDEMITDLVIPSTATHIGDYAFAFCSNIATVTIPHTVKNIGKWAFGACYGLNSAFIGYGKVGEMNIGTNAFTYCLGLENVVLGDSVNNIGSRSFANCINLYEVSIGNNVTNIGEGAFACTSGAMYYSRLHQCKIGNNVRSIGGGAFLGCTNLTSITIPESVASIGVRAFSYCDALAIVKFEGNAPTVGNSAFSRVNSNCTAYVREGSTGWGVEIPGTWKGIKIVYGEPQELVTYILSFSANGGSGTMAAQTFTNGVEQALAQNTFACEGYTFDGWATNANGGVVYTDEQRIVASSDMMLYAHWTEDGGSSGGGDEPVPYGTPIFTYEDGVLTKVELNGETEVVVPDDVTSIGEGAFNDLGLTKLTICSSVTNIHPWAFDYCSSLVEIMVDAGNPAFCSKNGMLLTKDGKTLVQGVNGDVVIHSGVTCIGDSAFYGCGGLKSVTIPASVTEIDSYAFDECVGLSSFTVAGDNPNYKAVGGMLLTKDGAMLIKGIASESGAETIPSGVKIICDSAFYGLDNLASVTIPDGVTSIGDYAFAECSGLTSVTIPDSVTSIGNSAFYRCMGLTSVTIGNGVTSIGDYAFDECSGLTSVTMPDSVTSIGGYAFSWCYGLTGVTIPDGVTSIGTNAFYACIGLTSVTIPDSVTSIGEWAFGYCKGLTSVTIPSSVTSIEQNAFADCTGLTSVTLPAWFKDNLPANVFSGCPSTLVITYRVDDASVIFDSVGGKFSNGAATKTTTAKPGNLWGKLPMPSKSGQVFDGWYTAASGGTIVTASSSVPSASTTYYARWTPRLGLAAASEWSGEFQTDSWCGQGTVSYDGKDALRSGIIYDNQSSYLITKVSGPGVLTFWWAVSCEAGGKDALRLLVDGAQVDMISGEVDWTKVEVEIPGTGTHTIKWNYTKNGSVTKGEDFGWVDKISWAAATEEEVFVFDANGGKFSNGATVKKTDATPGNLWGKMYMPAKDGQVFVGWFTAKEGGTQVTSSSAVPNYYCTYYARWTPRLGLAAASEWPYEFQTDSWCGQGAVSHDGKDALRTGIIYDSQNSYLITRVTGAGTLTFWWKVSCEAGGNDALRFLVDGSQKYSISGEKDWAKVTVDVTGSGTHVLKWNYTKNGSVSKGQDFGWIDQIFWQAK